jgi:hypothetical protein
MIGQTIGNNEIVEKLGEVPIRLDLALHEFAGMPNPRVGLSIPKSSVGIWKRRLM